MNDMPGGNKLYLGTWHLDPDRNMYRPARLPDDPPRREHIMRYYDALWDALRASRAAMDDRVESAVSESLAETWLSMSNVEKAEIRRKEKALLP